MDYKKKMTMLFALVLMSLTLPVYAGGAQEETEMVKDEVVVALSADITSLDPQGHNDTKSEMVSFLLFNRLFRLNTDFEVVPDLAESWEQPSDTEWVIKIKEGVKFHDGSEMTAEDVKFSMDRSKEAPKVQQVLSEVASIEVVDKYTVKFTTNSAFAPFLYTLVHAGTSVVPKAYVESGDEFAKPIGSGPYTFVEWISGDQVVLKKNEAYFDKNNMGQSSTITFKVIPEGTSRTIALETGEVDVVPELPTIDMNVVKDNSDLALYEKPSTRVDFFAMNTEKAPFDNVKVRQALNYAIDKDAIITVAIDGAGVKAESVLAPSFLGYKAGPYSYNPAKAKELLAAAGYPDGFEMEIMTSGDDRKKIAEVIQASLMEVGIKASIKMLEWGTFIDSVLRGDEETLILGWTSNPDPDATLTPHWFSGNIGGMNFARVNDPEMDRMLKEGREELDLGKREVIYNKLHTYIMDKAPWVPLFVKNNIVGANAALKGVELSPQGLWNLEKLHY
ncbi:ABC transporter substrate-binding protein [Spirochaeta isovalerica]|uniref:Peptide/nickel transport system substrate-binding protein n=1 Tax=Spirochaeta isovalerica TaxID=150 RepID=A0A841RJJ7_9SPIO|nr:ABC transporter substrate-binding protein [Spirochaeta isovalerica]MBB6482668.1 peptide/nickel transport system substrate-binding protein [Spirochaeta isovalerica]